MREIFDEIVDWDKNNRHFAMATVVKTWRSAPRQPGSSMIIDDNMSVVGSVSGGCIEGDVMKAAQEVMKTGSAQFLSFGVSNDDAWSAGLSCGGGIEVFVQKFFIDDHSRKEWESLKDHIQNDQSCVLVTHLTSDPEHILLTTVPEKELPFGMEQPGAINQSLYQGVSQVVESRDAPVFIHAFPSKPKLLVIGASHISYDLVRLAQMMGFSVSVIDPRGIFTDSLQNLCTPEQLIRQWPAEALPEMELDRSFYTVVLTHDPKIDDQALHWLLRSPVSYIGALGSRKTHEKRKQRLREAGFNDAEIMRIHGPVGLDIGASSPAEIALSIISELVRERNKTTLFDK